MSDRVNDEDLVEVRLSAPDPLDDLEIGIVGTHGHGSVLGDLVAHLPEDTQIPAAGNRACSSARRRGCNLPADPGIEWPGGCITL